MTMTESGTVRTRDRRLRTFCEAGLTGLQNISICAAPTVSRRDGGVVTQRTANPLPDSANPHKYAVLPLRSRDGFLPSRGTGCALSRTGAGSPPWDSRGNYLLPETLPVMHYPDGRRVVGFPGSWHWLATGGAA